MRLIDRLARLLKADFHAVLDRVEEPKLMLRQAIREMDDDLAARERQIRLAAHERQRLHSRRDELTRTLGEIGEQLELCFRSGKMDLARSLLRRKLEAERLSSHLEDREAALADELAGRQARLEEHRITVEGFRQKADILARRTDDESGAALSCFGERRFAVSDEEIEIALLREQAARSGP